MLRTNAMGLAQKLWLMLLVPMAIALGIHGWLAHESRQQVLMAEASAELRNYTTLIEAAVSGPFERQQVELVKQRLERLVEAERILGIATFDLRGGLLLVTDDVADVSEELADFARRATANPQELEELRELAGRPVLMRSAHIERKSEPFVAVVVRDLSYMDALSSTLNRGLIVTGFFLLGFTAIVTAIVSRAAVGRPANAIVSGVERVAAGDLETKVPEEGGRELARLASAFNAMTASLAEARKKLQEEAAARLAVERKLQHAQALAAVGQVTASIAHEVGSPLNVILGRAMRAAARTDCDEAARREFETIAAQSERISRVVSRLLAAARPPRSSTGTADLARVVQDALAFLGPECRERRVKARFENGGAGSVALDPDRTFQVVFNLCLNAVQAQTKGGSLLVRLLPPETGPGGALRCVFEVEDWGPGISEEHVPHIFDAFFTSKQQQGGSGLGLAIVSGIVREAGGTVELVPCDHPGARFRVTLPEASEKLAGAGAEIGPREGSMPDEPGEEARA